MKVSDSITAFLKSKRPAHNGQDLLDFYLRFGASLETQVNVTAGNGRPIPGKKSTYTDGLNEWWSIRIPKQADADPLWKEYDLKWPLELHAEAIGSTGWDWKARRSRYVGFDFDSIAGHAVGVGVTDDKLDAVRDAAKALPFVQARRSTGGAGLHLYVFFDDEGVPTENHTVHAALARCVLGEMSAATGFDFASHIDACGGNMWLWHKKTSKDNNGLSLIKPAEHTFSGDKLPSNWRDHIPVVTRQRTKVRVGAVDEQDIDTFEALASAHRVIPLDAGHRAQIDEMVRMGITATVWIPDHHLLQAHTVGFKRLMEEKQEEFGLQGFFQTIAPGRDLASPNCFAFPGDNGSWRIHRFSPGIKEAPTWEQDGQGWTTCWFNRRPNLKAAARALGGNELKKGGFEFQTLADAAKVVEALGREIEIDEQFKDREAVITSSKEGRVAIEVAKERGDPRKLGNWNSADKKNYWTQVFDVFAEPVKDEITDFDDRLRALVTPAIENAGWAVKTDKGEWTRQPTAHVKMRMQGWGHAKTEAEVLMGTSIGKPWKLVCLPFQPEYPGDRQWNADAPQYAFQPAPRGEDSETLHPHWDMIFDHVGRDLDDAIADLDWARRENIRTGADYLRAWYACVLREPYEPTPYLFLFGPENCGKSILWESFEKLITRGVVKADRALTSQNDFNGEIANAILCVVEEKDISKSPGAHAKIKDAVTSPMLSIRKMRTDSYQIPNMTHWIQCSNHREACPVWEGDTRITVIFVNPITKEIPKRVLKTKLEEEAPYFMRTLMDLQLPAVEGRLRLPVVATSHKAQLEELTRNLLDAFIKEQAHYVPGEAVSFADFFARFQEWLPPEELHHWSRIKVSKGLPMRHPSGASTNNKKHVGNMAWEPMAPAADAKPFVVHDGKLRKAP